MSESENPVIDAPEPKGTAPHTNKDWWPNQIDLSVLHPHAPAATRWATASTTQQSSPSSTSRRSSRTSWRCSTPRRTAGRPTSATTAA